MPVQFSDDESAFDLMVVAMKSLEAQSQALTEQSLYDAVKDCGVTLGDVREFLVKVGRGRSGRRGSWEPGQQGEQSRW